MTHSEHVVSVGSSHHKGTTLPGTQMMFSKCYFHSFPLSFPSWQIEAGLWGLTLVPLLNN